MALFRWRAFLFSASVLFMVIFRHILRERSTLPSFSRLQAFAFSCPCRFTLRSSLQPSHLGWKPRTPPCISLASFPSCTEGVVTACFSCLYTRLPMAIILTAAGLQSPGRWKLKSWSHVQFCLLCHARRLSVWKHFLLKFKHSVPWIHWFAW